jgi:hypothetical protein
MFASMLYIILVVDVVDVGDVVAYATSALEMKAQH